MKNIFSAFVLLISFIVFAKTDEDNDNWPCYLKKCSRSDPNINKCLLYHANRALPFIFPGDPKIGIPNFTPLSQKNINLGKEQTFKIHFDNVDVFGINHLRVENMNWNFKAKTMKIKFVYNNAIFMHGNYKSSGTFLGKSADGKGFADLVFIGGSYGANITYSMKYDLIQILGKEYIQIKHSFCNREEGFRVNFSNELLSKQEVSSNRTFINEHASEANKALNNDIKELICGIIELVLNPIFYNFPINIIFDE